MCAHSSIWNQVSTEQIPYLLTTLKLTFFVAFLDIEDINKAFQDMHEEVEQKVYRADLDSAL